MPCYAWFRQALALLQLGFDPIVGLVDHLSRDQVILDLRISISEAPSLCATLFLREWPKPGRLNETLQMIDHEYLPFDGNIARLTFIERHPDGVQNASFTSRHRMSNQKNIVSCPI